MAVAGFTGLAGALMILGGLWSVVVGIVALSNRHFVFTSANYTFAYTIHNWGWFDLILGCVVFAAGVCLFLGMAWARFLGVGLAIISAVGNFMFIPHQPLWSIVVIAVDALIIWALLSPRHSGELA